MTDDLVQRLKGHSEILTHDKGKFVRFIDVATCTEAIDRIEAQAAEIERLREALAHIANTINIVGSPYHKAQEALDQIVTETKRAARAALKEQSK